MSSFVVGFLVGAALGTFGMVISILRTPASKTIEFLTWERDLAREQVAIYQELREKNLVRRYGARGPPSP